MSIELSTVKAHYEHVRQVWLETMMLSRKVEEAARTLYAQTDALYDEMQLMNSEYGDLLLEGSRYPHVNDPAFDLGSFTTPTPEVSCATSSSQRRSA